MQHRRFRAFALLLTLAGAAACADDSPGAPAPRVLTSVTVSVPSAAIEVGQTTTATAAGLDQDGAPITLGRVTWRSESSAVATVQPATGSVFAIAPGTTRIRATVSGKTGERAISVVTVPAIRINEIQPRGDTSAGWVEFFNPTPAAVDLSGWSLIDGNVFGTAFTFPPGTTIPAGGFLVTEEVTLPFGVDAADVLHLVSRYGVQVDATFWAAQPATTLGRCPEGPSAVLVVTAAATKGAANACPPADAALGGSSGPGAVRSAR